MNSYKLLISSFLCAMLSFPLSAQVLNDTQQDKNGNVHLIGLCDRSGLEQAPFASWFAEGYDNYELDSTLLEQGLKDLEGLTIDIFMATWCGDSRREVPRFYKVLDFMGLEENQIRLVNVYRDEARYKQSPTHEEIGKLLHRVPTMIMYRDGEEIGRIVEYPVSSLEMDFLQIIKGFPSAPRYYVVPLLNASLENGVIPTDRSALLEIAKSIRKVSQNDRELNSFGYFLLRRNEVDKAIAVFIINSMMYARNPNVYDSLGEAYEYKKDWEQALKMYKQVLTLDAQNERALEKVQSLEEKIRNG